MFSRLQLVCKCLYWSLFNLHYTDLHSSLPLSLSLPPFPFQCQGQPSPIIRLQTISLFKFSHLHYTDWCLLGSNCFYFHCIFFSPFSALLLPCSHPLPQHFQVWRSQITGKCRGKKSIIFAFLLNFQPQPQQYKSSWRCRWFLPV